MVELFIQLFITLLFFIVGWAVRKKKAYWLLSGFSFRSKEEQKQLIQNGYPQKTGAWLLLTSIGNLILLPLSFTSFSYALEVQFGFILVFTLGGIVYLSKYEIPKKRKRSYIITSTLFIVIIGFITTLLVIGEQKNELILKEKSFEITGMYGDEWLYSDIKKIKLLKKMPTVTWKQNGFGTERMAKGHFEVEGYGSSLLFIKKEQSSQILYLEMKDEKIFINGESSGEVKNWYTQLIKN